MKLFQKISAVAAAAVITVSLSGCSSLAMGVAVLVVPYTVGIVNSSGNAVSEANAVSIDAACKDYFAGVTSGVINNSDKYAPNAPSKGSTTQQRRSGANKATIHDALVYAGLQSQENNLSGLGVNLDGTIIDRKNVNYKLKLSSISKDTTLSELYN